MRKQNCIAKYQVGKRNGEEDWKHLRWTGTDGKGQHLHASKLQIPHCILRHFRSDTRSLSTHGGTNLKN